MSKIKYEVKEDLLSITFGEGVKADKGQAYSQAAVVFGLAENIDSVKVKYNDGTEYTFNKNQVNKDTKSDVTQVTKSEENFVKYTEEIKEQQEYASVRLPAQFLSRASSCL